MTIMPTTCRRRITRRAVMVIAGVVLLVAGYLGATPGSAEIDQRIVGTWYCKDSPGYFIKYLADGSYELWGDGALYTADSDDRWFYRNRQIVRPLKSEYATEQAAGLVRRMLTRASGTKFSMGSERHGIYWEEVLAIDGSTLETRTCEGNRHSWIRVRDSEIRLVIPDASLHRNVTNARPAR